MWIEVGEFWLWGKKPGMRGTSRRDFELRQLTRLKCLMMAICKGNTYFGFSRSMIFAIFNACYATKVALKQVKIVFINHLNRREEKKRTHTTSNEEVAGMIVDTFKNTVHDEH